MKEHAYYSNQYILKRINKRYCSPLFLSSWYNLFTIILKGSNYTKTKPSIDGLTTGFLSLFLENQIMYDMPQDRFF